MFRRVQFSWISIAAIFVFIHGCGILSSDSDSGREPLGGDPSPMGAVGHEFNVVSPVGVSNDKIIVTENENGISTVEYSGTINNPMYLEMLKAMPDVVVNGNQATVQRKYRITTKGFQSVYEEGNLTIMNYEADVGDTYSMNRNGKNLKRTVTKKSTEDDYPWAFFMIKTVHVEETGRGIPGLSKVEFVGNHRFGMVGFKIYYEDGSSQNFTIIGDAEND